MIAAGVTPPRVVTAKTLQIYEQRTPRKHENTKKI